MSRTLILTLLMLCLAVTPTTGTAAPPGSASPPAAQPAMASPAASLRPSVKVLRTFTGPGIAANPEVETPPALPGLVSARSLAWSLECGEPTSQDPGSFAVRLASSGLLLVGASASCRLGKDDTPERVVFSPAGDRALLFFPVVHGDIARFRVDLLDLATHARGTVSLDPVAFAEFTPDGRYLLTEGPALLDADPDPAGRTRLDLEPRLPYARVLGWIGSGPAAVLVTYQNWEAPREASQVRLDFH